MPAIVRLVLVATLVIACLQGANAINVGAIFRDRQAIQDALAQIGAMKEGELRSFTRYLAECRDQDIAVVADPISLHACNKAEAFYTLEFGPSRPIDRLIKERSTLRDLSALARGREPSDAKQLFSVYHDLNEAFGLMEIAAASRFEALRRSMR